MHSLGSPQQHGIPLPCSTGSAAKPGKLSCAGRQTRSNHRGRSTFGVDQSQRAPGPVVTSGPFPLPVIRVP